MYPSHLSKKVCQHLQVLVIFPKERINTALIWKGKNWNTCKIATWLLVNTLKMCSSAFGANPWHSLMLAITPATKVPWPKPITGRSKQNVRRQTISLSRICTVKHCLYQKSHQSNRLYNNPQTPDSVLVFLNHILLLGSVGPEFPALSSQLASWWSFWVTHSRAYPLLIATNEIKSHTKQSWGKKVILKNASHKANMFLHKLLKRFLSWFCNKHILLRIKK